MAVLKRLANGSRWTQIALRRSVAVAVQAQDVYPSKAIIRGRLLRNSLPPRPSLRRLRRTRWNIARFDEPAVQISNKLVFR